MIGGRSKRVYAHAGASHRGLHPVTFSNDLDELFDALDVIDGARPSLAGSSNPLAKHAPAPGSFLFLVATDVSKLTDASQFRKTDLTSFRLASPNCFD